MDVKNNRKLHLVGQNASQAAETIKNAENHPDFSSLVRKESRKIIGACLRVHQEFLHRTSALSTNQRIYLVGFLIITAQPRRGILGLSSSMMMKGCLSICALRTLPLWAFA
jgi:hypothetical protein